MKHYLRFMNVNIGEEIKRVLESSEMTVTAFAKKINMERTNVYDIFKRSSIDTQLLNKIGQVLNYNFFELYVPLQHSKPKTVKILIELEVDPQEVLNLNLKDKILKVLTK